MSASVSYLIPVFSIYCINRTAVNSMNNVKEVRGRTKMSMLDTSPPACRCMNGTRSSERRTRRQRRKTLRQSVQLLSSHVRYKVSSDEDLPCSCCPEIWYDAIYYEVQQPNDLDFLYSNWHKGFQEDLEKGKAKHLFPTMFAKEQIKRGQLKQEDVPVRPELGIRHCPYELRTCRLLLYLTPYTFHFPPIQYMQRLGSWDDSDIKGAKKKDWSDTDKRMESKVSSWLRMRDARSPWNEVWFCIMYLSTNIDMSNENEHPTIHATLKTIVGR